MICLDQVVKGAARLVAGLSVALFTLPAHAEWRDALNGCSLFSSEQRQATVVTLPAGPMENRRRATGRAGVAAGAVVQDAGELFLSVYDCPAWQSSPGIAADMRRRLRAAGWAQHYRCDGAACGLEAGWGTTFPALRATPKPASQRYTLMTRQGPYGLERLALFATDLDGAPRIVAYRLNADHRLPVKPDFDLGRVQPLYDRQEPSQSLRFTTGSSWADAHLRTVEDDDGARWVVVGHADERGGDVANSVLAWHRARSVANALSRAGVPADAIDIYAVGDLLPVSAGFDHGSLARNRRVDIFRIAAPLDEEADKGDETSQRTREPDVSGHR